MYREQMGHLAREAKSCGMPLEMNLLGVWSRRNYPDRRFWELAAEAGCTAVLGCDAHAPDQLRRVEAEEVLLRMAGELEIPVLEKVALQKI